MVKLNKLFKSRNNLFLWLLFFVFTFIFWFFRLWRFEELMTFHLDQGLFMEEVWRMVSEGKPRLVGPIVTSKIILGRGFFIGPAFYYVLAALAILSNWKVILMTKVLILVWWLAALGVLLWLGKKYDWLTGLAVYGIFSSFPYFISFSRLMWNPNFLPLVGLGFFWTIDKLWRKEKLFLWFLAGLFFGLGVNFHYAAMLWLIFLTFFWALGVKRKKWKKPLMIWPIFILGAAIGDLPLLIFELRHNFYNLKTIFFFIQHGGLTKMEGGFLGGYFLFSLVPLFSWVFASLFFRLKKRRGFFLPTISILILTLMLAFNSDWRAKWGTGMPDGWNIEKQRQVAHEICQDVSQDETDYQFEIATTISGDTRAGDLRWWFSREGCTPLGVEDYPRADVLYLIAPQERTPEKETAWEVEVMRPFSVAEEKTLNDGIVFYKLERN